MTFYEGLDIALLQFNSCQTAREDITDFFATSPIGQKVKAFWLSSDGRLVQGKASTGEAGNDYGPVLTYRLPFVLILSR